MRLWGLLSRYWINPWIPWKPGRVGAIVLVARWQAVLSITNIFIRAIGCICPRVCPNLPWYSIYALLRLLPVNKSAAMSSFLYVDSVLKCVSTFLNFSVGDHSFSSFMMWSVLPTLKPRGDWKDHTFRYLRP